MNEQAIDRLNALKRRNDELDLLDTDDIEYLIFMLQTNDKQRLNASLEN